MALPKTILIVDDDREFVQGLRLVIERLGYRVLSAHDGEAGLAVSAKEQSDLVLVDMMMPKKSGFLVLEGLKTRNRDRPKVVMMTANEGARHRAYAEMLGVDDYLRKPFPIDRLLETVKRLCPLEEAESGEKSKKG